MLQRPVVLVVLVVHRFHGLSASVDLPIRDAGGDSQRTEQAAPWSGPDPPGGKNNYQFHLQFHFFFSIQSIKISALN